MNNNLTTTNQNAKLALTKSKSLLSVTNSILSKKENNQLIKDDWIARLWKWANENYIPDFGTKKGRSFDDKYDTWDKGIPREKTRLLELLELDLSSGLFNGNIIRELPNEITNLTHIKSFSIHNQNFLSKLPDKISNLKNLEKLNLASCKSLLLTEEQKDWINKLKNNGCLIYADDDLFSRDTQIIASEDESYDDEDNSEELLSKDEFYKENIEKISKIKYKKKNPIPLIDIDEDEIPF